MSNYQYPNHQGYSPPCQQPYHQQPYQQTNQQSHYPPGPPPPMIQNSAPNFQPPPYGYPQSQGQAPSFPQGPPIYYPRFGFTRLHSRFHIWNVVTGGGSSVLELGPQFKGPVAYSAKMFSSSRLKVKEGPYESGKEPICTIESRHTFSQKSTISFNGFQSQFTETSMFMDGASWPFDVDVNGQTQTWQWRKRQAESTSSLKRFFGSSSQSNFGSWDLIPASGQGPPVAAFEAGGGKTSENDAAIGEFLFYGPAAVGQMGDIFINVTIAILLRIISQHYISRIAASVG